jgi:hypothetical protein
MAILVEEEVVPIASEEEPEFPDPGVPELEWYEDGLEWLI